MGALDVCVIRKLKERTRTWGTCNSSVAEPGLRARETWDQSLALGEEEDDRLVRLESVLHSEIINSTHNNAIAPCYLLL